MAVTITDIGTASTIENPISSRQDTRELARFLTTDEHAHRGQ
jgi:hypothetical protein